MVLFDAVADRPARSPIARIVQGVAKWVADARAERKRRTALQALLFMPEHRLRDLGIRREELLEALERRHGRPGSSGHFN